MWVLPLLFALIKPAPVSETSHSSLLLRNGTVLTMDEAVPVAQAVLVQDGLIVAVGSDEETSDLASPGVEVIDLQGKTLLPGFIDSHAHHLGDRNLAGYSTPEDAVQAVLEKGWTSISELFVNQDRLDELRSLDEQGHLRLRVNAYLPLNWQYDRFGDWYQSYLPGQEYSPRLRIAGVKIFTDGGGGYGQDVYFTQEELNQLVAEAHQAGFQIATHTLGSASHLDLVLNAYEYALQGKSNEIRRHRVEHLTMLRDDQLERMRDLGIIASFQLTWFHSDWLQDEEFETVVTEEGVDRVGRWRDLLEAGVPSIGSTDYPWGYCSGSPIQAIYQAVTRIGEQGIPPRQWMLDQRITVEQALRLITIDAAYGTFQEDVKGSITPGKYADLVVLSKNPLNVAQEELLDIQVLMTMVGGIIEYLSFESGPFVAETVTTTIASTVTKTTTIPKTTVTSTQTLTSMTEAPPRPTTVTSTSTVEVTTTLPPTTLTTTATSTEISHALPLLIGSIALALLAGAIAGFLLGKRR